MIFLVGKTDYFEIDADDTKSAIEIVKSRNCKSVRTSYSCIKDSRHKLMYSEWPLWAKALKLAAKPEDKGIGDVIARIIGDENSEAFNQWHIKTFGKPCGCKGKQARLNQQYPLTTK